MLSTRHSLDPLRVLVVSYAFPPYAAVGSIRVGQFCRYLPEYGIEPVVLSVEEQFYDSLDDTRKPPSSLQLLRTAKMSTPLDWYGSAKRLFGFLRSRTKSESGPPGEVDTQADTQEKRSRWRESTLAWLQIPDRDWGWYLPAVSRAIKFVQQQRVDAVFSSGPPWTSHLVARRLKSKFGVPWLADFRDPWASLRPLSPGPKGAHQLAVRLERSCIRMADLVICNTDPLRDAFQSYYSSLSPGKFRTLTNGFGDLPDRLPGKSEARRLILHLGSIYGHRHIDTFLVALVKLVHSGRLEPSSFRVVFQGEVDSLQLAEAARIAPDLLQRKCVEFLPRSSWDEAQQLLWQSDLLLLFQGGQKLQVPAKFYEYLLTGIPMFAVAEKGALPDLIDSTASGIWVSPRDPETIAETFLRALRLPKHSPEEVSQRLSGQYHYRALTRQLSSLIREVTAKEEASPVAM